MPILLVTSAALAQPRLEGQTTLGSPAQPGYPVQQAAPNPTLSPALFSSALLHAAGTEDSSLEADILGIGQHSMTICCASWQSLDAAVGSPAAGFTAGFDGIALGRRKWRALVFVLCQPSCSDLIYSPCSERTRATVLPLTLARTRCFQREHKKSWRWQLQNNLPTWKAPSKYDYSEAGVNPGALRFISPVNSVCLRSVSPPW